MTRFYILIAIVIAGFYWLWKKFIHQPSAAKPTVINVQAKRQATGKVPKRAKRR